MIFGILAIVSVAVAWKWGDWKNWKNYYPTIAFWIIGNYLYDTLTCDKPLWLYYAPGLNNTIIDLFWKFIIYPCTALIFLYRYPKSGIMPALKYFAFWILVFSLLEWILLVTGHFLYYNNWNLWWSIAFNSMMFPVLRLHQTHTSWAWATSIVVGIAIIIVFQIPIMTLR